MSNVQDPRTLIPQLPSPFPPWTGPWWPMPMPMPTPGPTSPWPWPSSTFETRGVVPPQTPESFPPPIEPRPMNPTPRPAPAPLSAAEREVLGRVLRMIRDNRARPGGSPLDSLRALSAFAYLAGFLEARGHGSVGDFLATIPPSSEQAAAQLDQFLAGAEAAVADPDTRMGPLAALAIGVAGCAIWDGIKWAYGKATE